MKKLAKLLLSGIIAGSMIFGTSSVFANTNQVVKIKIGSNVANVNGQNVKMDAMPYIQQYTNVTMIPLRFVATALGIDDNDITYNAEARRVAINTNKRFNEVDEVVYFINQSIGNYGYAELKNGRTYIPLRVLCNSLSLSVEWDSTTKTATMKANQNINSSIVNNIQNNSSLANNSTNQNATNTQDVRAMEEEVVRLVNEERTKYGIQPLEIDETLMQGAKLKSEDMNKNNYISHTSPTYGSPTDMMKNIFGYKFNGYYAGVGENITTAGGTPEGVVSSWMNSEGHRANILDPNYKYIGVGASNGIWTQIFAG